mmetsp:Transcript_1478/g.2621  ORF Transcript_1478/g.2621 Transcript_1478/m.2621 type:complete len:250 (-) Transcript_1478:876-1625(-)
MHRHSSRQARRVHGAGEDCAHAVLFVSGLRERSPFEHHHHRRRKRTSGRRKRRRRRRRRRRRHQISRRPIRGGQRPRRILSGRVAGHHRLLHERRPRTRRRCILASQPRHEVRRWETHVVTDSRGQRIHVLLVLAALHLQPSSQVDRRLLRPNLHEGRDFRRLQSHHRISHSNSGRARNRMYLHREWETDCLDPASSASRRVDGRVFRGGVLASSVGDRCRRSVGRCDQGRVGTVSSVRSSMHGKHRAQ